MPWFMQPPPPQVEEWLLEQQIKAVEAEIEWMKKRLEELRRGEQPKSYLEEELSALEDYRNYLREELKGVEERIAEIRRALEKLEKEE